MLNGSLGDPVPASLGAHPDVHRPVDARVVVQEAGRHPIYLAVAVRVRDARPAALAERARVAARLAVRANERFSLDEPQALRLGHEIRNRAGARCLAALGAVAIPDGAHAAADLEPNAAAQAAATQGLR